MQKQIEEFVKKNLFRVGMEVGGRPGGSFNGSSLATDKWVGNRVVLKYAIFKLSVLRR